MFSVDSVRQSCAVDVFLGGRMRVSPCKMARKEEVSGVVSSTGLRRLGCQMGAVDEGCFAGSHGRVCTVFECSGCIVWNSGC